jgi:hypothetical protein
MAAPYLMQRVIALFARHGVSKTFSKTDMIAVLHCDRRSLDHVLTHLLRKPHRCVHVCAWTTSSTATGRPYIRPVFAFGDRADKPRPAVKTKAYYRARDQIARERMALTGGKP